MCQIIYTNVSKHFGETKALDGLNLNIQKGDIYGLLGHNGAGKTTALRVMLGLLPITDGNISVFGLDPIKEGGLVRKKCGVLSENIGLYEPLTVYDNLVYFAQIYGMPKLLYEKRMDELLELFDFSSKKNVVVKELSLGTKKKAAIVRALLHEPEIVLLDEPTNGLDPISTEKLRETILLMSQQKQTTFIITTHNLHQAEKTCNKIAILKQGKATVTKDTKDLDFANQDLLKLYMEVENEEYV
jgi:ABC-2 type transport system ATP-binding protein